LITGGPENLLTKLRSAHAWERAEAAKELGLKQDARAVEALLEALSDSVMEVREEVAEALGVIGDSRAIPGLLDQIRRERQGKPSAAATALARIGRPGFEAAVRALRDSDPNLRYWAAVALARTRNVQALPELQAAAAQETERTYTGASVKLGIEKAIKKLSST
jgi:HEAT repeat protein